MTSTTTGKAIAIDDFLRLRQEVLTTWPTGAEVDLEEAIRYQRAMPPSKCFARAMREADRRRPAALAAPRRRGPAGRARQIAQVPGDRRRRRPAAHHHRRLHAAEPLPGGRQGDRKIAGHRRVDAQRLPGRELRGEELPAGDRGAPAAGAGPPRHARRPPLGRDRPGRRIHQLRGRRHLLQHPLCQECPPAEIA